MNFSDPLLKGTLVHRYKRFLADIVLENGDKIIAHCANSGSMLGLKKPGSEVWVSPAHNRQRKLKYTWELIRVGESLVGINTAHPNKIVQEAIEGNRIPALLGYDCLKREVRYGKNSRIDILLASPGKPLCYVEVKNVTLKRKNLAEFPDAITSRGTKHLGELSDQVRVGNRSVMFYLIQRDDCEGFTVADDIDPAYAQALDAAIEAGVEVLCYQCKLTPKEITIDSVISSKI